MSELTEKEFHDQVEDTYRRMYLEPDAPAPSMTAAEYRGLYGEVVTNDCYGLGAIEFQPEVIFDLGANVGVFTNFARRLFPEATIIAVEPDEQNMQNMSYLATDHSQTVFMEYAIGLGLVYSAGSLANGAHRSYICDGSEYLRPFTQEGGRYKLSDVPAITLSALMDLFPIQPRFIKVDIEGGEAAIFEHEKSMLALAETEAFAIELHDRWWATRLQSLLSETHSAEWEPRTCVLKARKRSPATPPSRGRPTQE